MPDYDFRTQRLLLEAPLQGGLPVPVSKDQANYLGNVLRLENKALLLVFNGRDGEWVATVERPGKRVEAIVPTARVRDQTPRPDLDYLFAPLKAGRLDYMVQKATEMGAGRLLPVMTQHGQVPRFNVERARANVVEAAEQCGVLSVPEVNEMRRLEEVLAGWDAARTLVFCDEREDGAGASAVLAPLAGRPLALLVGPEGGFSRAERESLRAHPNVVPLSLGPRILRADTAAVAALAILQALAGDWPR